MFRYAVMVITNGRRRLLERTLDSFDESVSPRPSHRILIDDSADPDYAHWLDVRYQGFTRTHHDSRRGFGGAVQSGWAQVRRLPPTIPWVVWVEDDFTFNEPVDVESIAEVMDANPHLAQIALVRQPVNHEERAAGGIVACHPDDYDERSDPHGRRWLEHRRCFTTNVCLIRAQLTRDHQWPEGALSEGMFTHHLLETPDLRFAYWGRKADPPRIHHIGDERAEGSCGY